MKKNSIRKASAPKRFLRLPDLDYSKTAVLNSLGSPDSRRSYRFAIDDFILWYCSEPRLAFGKTVVLRYRLQLEHVAYPHPPSISALPLFAASPTKRLTPDCSVPTWPLVSATSKERRRSACGLATGSLPIRAEHSLPHLE